MIVTAKCLQQPQPSPATATACVIFKTRAGIQSHQVAALYEARLHQQYSCDPTERQHIPIVTNHSSDAAPPLLTPPFLARRDTVPQRKTQSHQVAALYEVLLHQRHLLWQAVQAKVASAATHHDEQEQSSTDVSSFSDPLAGTLLSHFTVLRNVIRLGGMMTARYDIYNAREPEVPVTQ